MTLRRTVPLRIFAEYVHSQLKPGDQVWGDFVAREVVLPRATIYHLLSRTSKEGWFDRESESGPISKRPPRVYFTLTEKGYREVAALANPAAQQVLRGSEPFMLTVLKLFSDEYQRLLTWTFLDDQVRFYVDCLSKKVEIVPDDLPSVAYIRSLVTASKNKLADNDSEPEALAWHATTIWALNKLSDPPRAWHVTVPEPLHQFLSTTHTSLETS